MGLCEKIFLSLIKSENDFDSHGKRTVAFQKSKMDMVYLCSKLR